MERTGLRQLLERFNEIKVRLDTLKDRHDFRTYVELAEVSRALVQPGVFKFASSEELSKTILNELDEHKERSIIGIIKYVDNLFDRIFERVSEGKRYDRLESYFNLLLQHGLPNSYGKQADKYSEHLDEMLHAYKTSEALDGAA